MFSHVLFWETRLSSNVCQPKEESEIFSQLGNYFFMYSTTKFDAAKYINLTARLHRLKLNDIPVWPLARVRGACFGGVVAGIIWSFVSLGLVWHCLPALCLALCAATMWIPPSAPQPTCHVSCTSIPDTHIAFFLNIPCIFFHHWKCFLPGLWREYY